MYTIDLLALLAEGLNLLVPSTSDPMPLQQTSTRCIFFSVLTKQRVYDENSFALQPVLIHKCSIEGKQK